MKKNVLAWSVMAILATAACDKFGVDKAVEPTVACGNEQAAQLVNKILKEEVEKEVIQMFENENDEAFANIGVTQIRQMIDTIKFSLADVRTTEKTETSSKLQCEATLRLEVPQNIIQKAIDVNKTVRGNNKNTADFFEKDYRQEGGFYTKTIAYSVQPTDDKTKIFATVVQAAMMSKPISELVTLALMKEPVATAQAEAAQAEAVHEAEVEALNQAEQAAQIQEWTERHKVALKDINGFWNKLPKAVQTKFQATQAAWNESHQKSCAAEAKANSTTPTEEQLHSLMCRTASIEGRIAELKSQQDAMIGDLVKEADKKNREAAARFDRAVRNLPAEIAQQLNEDISSWANGLEKSCRKDNDEYRLLKSECETRALNAKAKELEGYSIQ